MKINDQNEKDLKKLAITYIEDNAFFSAKKTLETIILRREVIEEQRNS